MRGSTSTTVMPTLSATHGRPTTWVLPRSWARRPRTVEPPRRHCRGAYLVLASGDALKRYHDIMTRKATTVRLPGELADTAEVVACARGVSVNQVILDALQAEVDRVRQDEDFMTLLHTLVERDREILDRLAE